MATTVGSIKYTLELDTSKFDASLANVKSKLSGIKTSFDSTDKSLKDVDKSSGLLSGSFSKLSGAFAVGQIAAQAFISTISKIQSAVGSSFNALKDLEKSRASFEVLTGSAEVASKTIQDIAKFANQTPFEFPELAKSAKTLLGFGVSAADVNKRIRQIGDVSAATGGDLSGIATVVGQIFAAGKVNGQDYLQLINNSVALGPEIAKELGIPLNNVKKAIEDGAVTSDVFARALDKATTSGGKFFGGTEKLAGTLDGRISTLKDTFTGLVGSFLGVDFTTGLVEADGLFAKMSNGVKKLSDGLSRLDFSKVGDIAIAAFSKLSDFIYRNKDAIYSAANGLKDFIVEIFKVGKAIFEYLAPKIGSLISLIVTQLIPVVADFYNTYLKELARIVGTVLVVAIGLAIDAFKFLLGAFIGLVDFVNNNKEFLLPIIIALGTLAAALALQAAFSAFTAGFTIITSQTIPAVAAAFKGLAALIANPIVMPALAIGAALASIYEVAKAISAVKESFNQVASADNARKSLASTNDAYLADLRAKLQVAKSTNDTEAIKRLEAGIKKISYSYATGTNFAPGGTALVGEAGPELVNLPRGAQVIPADKTLSILSKIASVIKRVNYISPIAQSTQDVYGIESSIKSLDSAIKAISSSTNNTVNQRQVVIAAVPINGVTLTKEQLRNFYRDLTTAYGEDLGAFV